MQMRTDLQSSGSDSALHIAALAKVLVAGGNFPRPSNVTPCAQKPVHQFPVVLVVMEMVVVVLATGWEHRRTNTLDALLWPPTISEWLAHAVPRTPKFGLVHAILRPSQGLFPAQLWATWGAGDTVNAKLPLGSTSEMLGTIVGPKIWKLMDDHNVPTSSNSNNYHNWGVCPSFRCTHLRKFGFWKSWNFYSRCTCFFVWHLLKVGAPINQKHSSSGNHCPRL